LVYILLLVWEEGHLTIIPCHIDLVIVKNPCLVNNYIIIYLRILCHIL